VHCVHSLVIVSILLAALRAEAQESPAALVDEAIELASRGQHALAIQKLDRAVERAPEESDAYYWRGRSLFCQGEIKRSILDFDRLVKLAPKLESRQWERGIALYYAGEFERGAKQFELYQTYHDNDVENSTWRYLCVARQHGVAKARETLLPIKNDPRVPMMQIYDLYRGKSTPADVLAAIESTDLSERERTARAFYAHLYIGLWYEAAGDAELAAKHVKLAEEHKIGHYMWDVARVHRLMREKEKNEPKNQPK
jgi:lipoprotein NlpI